MNWNESIGFFKTMEACGSFITSTPARLPENGLSFKRGLYVRTAVPFRMMALVSWQEESSTTTNSVPKTKQTVFVCKIKKNNNSVKYSTCSHKNIFTVFGMTQPQPPSPRVETLPPHHQYKRKVCYLTCDIDLDIQAVVLSYSHRWPLRDHTTLHRLGHDGLSGAQCASGWFWVGLTWMVVARLVIAWGLHYRHSEEVLDQLEPLKD